MPNRNPRPAVLLRESSREDAKVKRRTLANLSKWPGDLVEGLRILLKGGVALPYKTVDLKVRPVHHRLEGRVRAHVFLRMLAHYVEWRRRRALAPLLFNDDDPAAAAAARSSPVAEAAVAADVLTSPTPLQVEAFRLLGVRP